MYKIHLHTPYWFSIIEVLIGMFVFSLGLVSIFALLMSSLNVNAYNKHAIIASNIARGNIEMIKNIRDTNYENLRPWNSYDVSNLSIRFENLKYYKISENDSGDIQLEELWNAIPEGESELANMGDMDSDWYRLCLNDMKYNYCSSSASSDKKTPYYSYVYFEEEENWVMKLTAKVIWFARWYHDYEISTLITDWQRL